MVDTNVQTLDEKGRQDKFLQRDLPVGYLLVRITMGFHMIGHGAVRLVILRQFTAETIKDFVGVTLFGIPLFQDWAVTILCYTIPSVEFVIGLLLTVGFKTRPATIAGSLIFIPMMFGMVMMKNFGTAHIMWWYVLIFAMLGALNFADRYSLDRMGK